MNVLMSLKPKWANRGMSLLIRGMDMPKDCAECDDMMLLLAIGCPYFKNGGRHENCPLVEVPKHGRLIDSSMAYQETLPYAEKTRKMILKVINSLPTVIEAEE